LGIPQLLWPLLRYRLARTPRGDFRAAEAGRPVRLSLRLLLVAVARPTAEAVDSASAPQRAQPAAAGRAAYRARFPEPAGDAGGAARACRHGQSDRHLE